MHRRHFFGALAAPALIAAWPSAAQASATELPSRIELPNGFRPEGIAIGPGPFAYLGSLANGDIYRADLRDGAGRIVSIGPGTPTVGVKTDGRGLLFAAGGVAGNGRVIDLRTGAILASYQFATGTTFVNDVILTEDTAWFTDSRLPFLYGVSRSGNVRSLELTGDLVMGEGNNLNGIARTPDQRALIVVQSNKGLLFRVSPRTGVATQIDVGAVVLANGDGLLQCGRTLYVVQNRLNQIAVIELSGDGRRGRQTRTITDPRFDVPTTVARFLDRLYLPNARFTTTPEPGTAYWVTAVRA